MTVAQVAAAFVTAGIKPVGDVASIAKVVSGQITMTRTIFSTTSFEAEPAAFLAKLIEETR